MKIIGMAFRNVGRNWRRSILAFTSVAISIFVIMLMDGLMTGFLGSIVKNYTKNETGHVNVTTAGYRARERFMPVDESITDSAAVAGAIRGIPELEGKIRLVAERIRFGVILASGQRSKTALAVAGDPEVEKKLLMLDRNILPGGSYIAAPRDAILGEKLAKDLGLAVGDPLKVVTERSDGGLGYRRFRIAGLFRTGVSSLDESVFQVSLADARQLLALRPEDTGGEEGGSQQILVMLDNHRDSDRAAALIGSALEAKGIGGLSAVSWTENGDFPRLLAMSESIYKWIYAIVAFLGAFIIANIMMMVVLERRKEIGILKSLGMPHREILSLFLTEGVMLGAFGSAIGAALGLAFNAVFSRVGFDFTAVMSNLEWPMDNVVYPGADPLAAFVFFLMGAAVAAVVSILPARSAARMNAVEAIRSAL